MSQIEVVDSLRITCSRPARRRRSRIWVAMLAGTVLLAGGWWFAGRDSNGVAVTNEQFRSYRDTTAGFAISHPVTWRPEKIADGVLFRLGGQDAVSVKRTRLARAVNAANVADMRAVTDAVLSAPEVGIDVLRAAPTTLGGLPGMHYLYTFSADGVRGAHTHWFAFSGRTMYTVVFQALPDARFAALAPVFDKVASSFRVLGS